MSMTCSRNSGKRISQDEIQNLYKKSINYGAHPNIGASVLSSTNTSGRLMASIVHGDPLLIKVILGYVEMAAVAVLIIFSTIFPNTSKTYNLDIRIQNLNKLFSRISPDTLVGINMRKPDN